MKRLLFGMVLVALFLPSCAALREMGAESVEEMVIRLDEADVGNVVGEAIEKTAGIYSAATRAEREILRDERKEVLKEAGRRAAALPRGHSCHGEEGIR